MFLFRRRPPLFRPGFALAALFAATSAGAAPSTGLDVDGAVSRPTRYDVAALQALPAVAQTVSFSAAGAAQTHDYIGTNLWNLLNGAGIVVGGNKNDVLNRYVLATGSDGYRVAFSLGELNPSFGNRPDLVAYQETKGGVTAPLASDGFARITAPGDAKGGRYLSNLTELTVGSAAPGAGGSGGVAAAFSVAGSVKAPASFDLAALEALPVTTAVVGTHTYTGVSFWDLLNSTVGLALDPAVKNDALTKLVVATGSDGYSSVFSLGEIDPDFGGQPDLIAYAVDGASLGVDGFARVVVPNDVKAGRWVSNLVSLQVFSAAPVPEPASWALLIGGLAFAGVAATSARVSSPQAALGVKRSARPFMQ